MECKEKEIRKRHRKEKKIEEAMNRNALSHSQSHQEEHKVPQDKRDDLHADDICQIKKSFWEERHVPDLGDIVEIQEGDKIRSYVYSVSESNKGKDEAKAVEFEWLFNGEVKVSKIEENDDVNENVENVKEDQPECQKKQDIPPISPETRNDSLRILRALQDIINMTRDKSTRVTKSTKELIDTLQVFIDKENGKNTNKHVNKSSGVEDEDGDDKDRPITGTKVNQETEKTNDVPKEEDLPPNDMPVSKSVKKEGKKKSEYNKFMSSCLLKIKEERKDILPNQRMAYAVEEWHRYKSKNV